MMDKIRQCGIQQFMQHMINKIQEGDSGTLEVLLGTEYLAPLAEHEQGANKRQLGKSWDALEELLPSSLDAGQLDSMPNSAQKRSKL